MRKFVYVLLALAMIVPMALSGCSKGEALAKELNIRLGTEPPTLDVALQTDTTSGAMTEMLFLGLTDLTDETVETVPELASKWEVSSDGLVWTFTMRKDVNWVRWDPATKKAEKLRKVVADDVVYAVKRMLDPATASNYAYVAYIIKGAAGSTTQARAPTLAPSAFAPWTSTPSSSRSSSPPATSRPSPACGSAARFPRRPSSSTPKSGLSLATSSPTVPIAWTRGSMRASSSW